MNKPVKPNPLLDPFFPAVSAWAIVSAASAGVFDALGESALTAADIAEKLGLDPAGVERLMAVLVHLGYAVSDQGRFALSDVSRLSLTESSQRRLANWVRFCRTQLLALSKLQSVLSTGRPVDLFDLMTTPEELRVHQLAMAETALPVAEWVAAQTPVPEGAEVMLDVGGSHGLYSAAICRRNPPLRAEVMELPVAIDAARYAAREFGTADLVTHIEGDIRRTSLQRKYSVVFAANLIHHVQPEHLPSVFEKVWDHLVPGGTFAIWDISENGGAADLFSSLFSLFFFLVSAGRCHPESSVEEALQRVGFGQLQAIRPDGPSLHTLHVVKKPSV